MNAVIEWMGPNGMLTSTSDGRLTVGTLEVDIPGREYERSVMFSSLSAEDSGNYSCSATIMPTMATSSVTNGVGTVSDSLTVASELMFCVYIEYNTICSQSLPCLLAPTLDVSIERTSVPPRILDVPTYNGFTLTCIATSRVAGTPTAITKAFTWSRSVDGGATEELIESDVNNIVMITFDGLNQDTATSILTVNTTSSGSHVYTCRAKLVVAPAPDDIMRQTQDAITVQGEPLLTLTICNCQIMLSLFKLPYGRSFFSCCTNGANGYWCYT